MRIALLTMLAACGTPRKEPTPWRPVPALHIAGAADVRWPVERSLFIGTVQDGMLRLDDGLAGPIADPRLVAIGAEIPDGRAAVSGIGRAVTRDEAAAGAMIALAEVQLEREIAAPHLTAYPILRRDGDLSIALAQTYVTAEGIVRARDRGFVLELPTREELPLLVVPRDGEACARTHVGKARHIYGNLTGDRVLAISQPTFDQ
jgi:hypothetical protein